MTAAALPHKKERGGRSRALVESQGSFFHGAGDSTIAAKVISLRADRWRQSPALARATAVGALVSLPPSHRQGSKLLIDMVQVDFDVPAARSSRRAISLSRTQCHDLWPEEPTILGSRIVKVEPRPGSLSTVMSPPII
jgi:hypothetical protein